MIEGINPLTGRPVRVDDGSPATRYVSEELMGVILGLPQPPSEPGDLPGFCDECGGGVDGTRHVHAAGCSRYEEHPPDFGPGPSTEWSPLDG